MSDGIRLTVGNRVVEILIEWVYVGRSPLLVVYGTVVAPNSADPACRPPTHLRIRTAA